MKKQSINPLYEILLCIMIFLLILIVFNKCIDDKTEKLDEGLLDMMSNCTDEGYVRIQDGLLIINKD